MTASSKSMDPASRPDDDIPDLTTPEWVSKFDSAKRVRGRPKAAVPKVSTTIRLDADILARFREQGPRWQTRINEALREWLRSENSGA